MGNRRLLIANETCLLHQSFLAFKHAKKGLHIYVNMAEFYYTFAVAAQVQVVHTWLSAI